MGAKQRRVVGRAWRAGEITHQKGYPAKQVRSTKREALAYGLANTQHTRHCTSCCCYWPSIIQGCDAKIIHSL